MSLSIQEDLSRRKWTVCGMLMLALVLNYMDRQTLSLTITAIEAEIGTNNQQYGRLEKGFGYAFAVGALAFGLIADRVSVRWLYPLVLMGWSIAGIATGYADHIGRWLTPNVIAFIGLERIENLTLTEDPQVMRSYLGFLVCRVVLGFFEAGQWPCALVTTQRLLSRTDRSLGNSILQAGASIGAILTPVVVWMFDPTGKTQTAGTGGTDQVLEPGWWRSPYVVIGVLGVFWVVPWLWTVKGIDLGRPNEVNDDTQSGRSDATVNRLLFLRRYVALIVVVVVINMTWQFFRVWLPKMLEQYHGYEKTAIYWFSVAYYIATDVGCIVAGAWARKLVQRGWRVHSARLVVYGACSALTSLSIIASQLGKGPLLVALFWIIGAGALGLFPIYYSLTQELSTRHQGFITGSLGFITWVVTSEMQEIVGKHVDETHSYAGGIFWLGLVPVFGLIAMILLWGRQETLKE